MAVGIGCWDGNFRGVGGSLLPLMLTASVILSPPGERLNSPVPSTYSAQSAGAEAAYLLLSQLHYPVRRWEEPPTELDADPREVLLILAEPIQPPSQKERKALLDFAQGGGHVIFTGSSIRNFFPGADVSHIPPDPVWKSFLPSIPNRLARGVQTVTIQPQPYLGRLNESSRALAAEPGPPELVRWNL